MMESGMMKSPHEGRIARSWRITKTAWGLVRRDRAMLALALLSTSSALVWLAVFSIFGVFSDPDGGQGKFLVATLISLYPATFISVFFNVALVSAANAALEGRRLSFGEAIGEASARLGKIALWSLFAAGVGVLIAELSSRLPGGARIAGWLLGAAWAVATLFVVPILAIAPETPGPIKAVRQSAGVVRTRWGEGISGSVTITAWTFFIALPAFILIAIGFAVVSGSVAAGAGLIAVGGLLVISTMAIGSAVQQVFTLCLYRYATEGSVSEFTEQDLAQPFKRRRRG